MKCIITIKNKEKIIQTQGGPRPLWAPTWVCPYLVDMIVAYLDGATIKSLSPTIFFSTLSYTPIIHISGKQLSWLLHFGVLSKLLHNWLNRLDPHFLQSNYPVLVQFTFCDISSFLKPPDQINVQFPIELVELASLVRFLKPWSNMKMFSFNCKTLSKMFLP